MRYLGCVLIGMLLGVVFMIDMRCNHGNPKHAAQVAQKKETAVVADISAHKFDSTTYYHDRYNQEHAQKALIQGDAAAVRIFYKHREDSLCKVIGISHKEIMGMYEAQSMVSGSFTTPTVIEALESVGCPEYGFTWSDPYAVFSGISNCDSTTAAYTISVPVTITPYWKRRWFLGKKHYFIDGYSSNKNVHITGLTGISINK